MKMNATQTATSLTRKRSKSRNRLRAVWRFSNNRLAVVGGVIILFFFILTIFAPVIAPYKPDEQHVRDRLKPPSAQYWMGTDSLGRDIFSRSVYACRVSIPIGFLAMFISMVVGINIGLLSGFFGGMLDNALMRFTDLVLSFPIFFLLLTIAAIFGPNITTIILMLGFTSWGGTARLMRGQVLSLREMPYIEAARTIGVKDSRIIFRHILINCLPVLSVTATLLVAYSILVEGGLSFLGLGVQPPMPSWGNMMAQGREILRTAWWASVFPGLFLFLAVISFNLFGDGIRDFFDPAKQYKKEKRG
jgi:peptide/nickel transport system permease protein